MPKMPSKVRIASLDYKIEEDTNITNEKGEYVWGLSSHQDTILSIDKALSLSHKKTVLLHEILHAVVYTTGFEFKDDREEEFVRTVTPTLLNVLQGNKKVMEYLTNAE